MENLSAENSLRLIAETIERSRKTIAKNSGKPLILWGCLVVITSIAVWALWSCTGSAQWNLLWFAMTVIGGIGTYFLVRNNEKVPETEVSRIIGHIWLWYGIFSIGMILLVLIVAAVCTALDIPVHIHFNSGPLIMVLLGLCGTISGVVMKMKAVTISSVVSTAICIVLSALIPEGDPANILVFAILGVFILIIPGILLQKKSR